MDKIILTQEQREILEKLRVYYCREFAEDKQGGTNFDNAILDLLMDSSIEQRLKIVQRRDEYRKLY